jgi:hypothetical protein
MPAGARKRGATMLYVDIVRTMDFQEYSGGAEPP